jgi:tRNA threonylcarbamoyladenosine biosynthesis protein TsaB
MNLLAIETSTEYCSLAVSDGASVHVVHELAGQRHAEMVLGAIGALLDEAGLAMSDLHGIAYGMGPGSFTGLRIACGVTQGLALARGIGVVGICTLEALAEESQADAVIACLDARMGEIYHAAYRRIAGATAQGATWQEIIAPGLYTPGDLPLADGPGWTGCGSGFAAHAAVLASRFASSIEATLPQCVPTAAAILRLATPVFAKGCARDAAEALPLYIRDKVALKKGEQKVGQ